jgi:hypothetical protein
MGNLELPVCRWRAEPTGPGRHMCVSRKVTAGRSGVPDAQCLTCRVRDHPPPPPPPGLCVHLGPRDSMQVCPPCSAEAARKVEIPVHACALHGRCTLRVPVMGMKVCQSCGDFSGRGPTPEVGRVRHLTYFVCPLGTVWRWNIAQLRQRMWLFNGRRHIVCVQGPGLAPLDHVQRELNTPDVDWFPLPNNPALKEYVGFPLLLRSLSEFRGVEDVTFYGHAKGVGSEAWGRGVRRWSDSMYSGLLDYWPAVQRLLASYCCVGLWRKLQGWYPASPSRWHYAGTFRWVRNADMYTRRWDEYMVDWCCPEDHVGRVFQHHESACLYGDIGVRPCHLYGPEWWDLWAQGERDRFEREHTADRMDEGALAGV